MKNGSTPHDLAFQVHTDIGKGFLYAVDARTKMRIKENHMLQEWGHHQDCFSPLARNLFSEIVGAQRSQRIELNMAAKKRIILKENKTNARFSSRSRLFDNSRTHSKKIFQK